MRKRVVIFLVVLVAVGAASMYAYISRNADNAPISQTSQAPALNADNDFNQSEQEVIQISQISQEEFRAAKERRDANEKGLTLEKSSKVSREENCLHLQSRTVTSSILQLCDESTPNSDTPIPYEFEGYISELDRYYVTWFNAWHLVPASGDIGNIDISEYRVIGPPALSDDGGYFFVVQDGFDARANFRVYDKDGREIAYVIGREIFENQWRFDEVFWGVNKHAIYLSPVDDRSPPTDPSDLTPAAGGPYYVLSVE